MMHFNSIPLHKEHPHVLLPHSDPHQEFFQKPKKDGLTAENPPPPQKQTYERLITFRIKKYVRYVHPSHPIPSHPKLKTGRSSPKTEYRYQHRLPHTK